MTITRYLEFPRFESLVIYAANVADYESRLSPGERAIVQHAVAKRRWEFATGRLCAHQGIAAITGEIDAFIASDAERRPIWPVGICGSITHTNQQALAAVAAADYYSGVGIDAEEISRVAKDLWPRLLRQTELAGLTEPADAATIFSAKEAVYKAINPIVGEFIGFQEVSITLDHAAGKFLATYHGDHAPNAKLESGRGYFRVANDLAICLFMIDKQL